jgi:hypothetical protein
MSTPTGGGTDRPDPSSDLPAGRTPSGAADSAPAARGDVAPETVAEPFTHRVRRAVLALASVLVVYYAAPVGELPSGVGIVFSVLGLLAGVGLLAWLIVRQGRRLMHSAPDDEAERPHRSATGPPAAARPPSVRRPSRSDDPRDHSSSKISTVRTIGGVNAPVTTTSRRP